jgi:hypothetical protein
VKVLDYLSINANIAKADGAPSFMDDKVEVTEAPMPAPTTTDVAVDSPKEDAPAIQEYNQFPGFASMAIISSTCANGD